MRYKYSDSISDRLINFVTQVDKKREGLYNSRQQTNKEHRLSQNFNGKLAELAINDHLHANYEDEILNVDGGGFAPDVIFDDMRISVKSQDPESQRIWGPNRYVFQDQDKTCIKKGVYTHLACVQIEKIGYNYIDYSIAYLGPIINIAFNRYFVQPKKSLQGNNKHILDLNLYLNDPKRIN